MLVGVIMAVVGMLVPWDVYQDEVSNGIQHALYDMSMTRPAGGIRMFGFVVVGCCCLLVADGALRVLGSRSGGMGTLGSLAGFGASVVVLMFETATGRPAELYPGAQLYYVSFIVVLVGALIVREARASQVEAAEA